MPTPEIQSTRAALAAMPLQSSALQLPSGESKSGIAAPSGELREAFDQFVGETFYSQMLKSMRKTVGKSAYFHGGQAEEMFRSQLDQVLAEKMTAASADQFTGPLFEQFTRQDAATRESPRPSGFLPLDRQHAPAPIPLSQPPAAIPLSRQPAAMPLPSRQPFFGLQPLHHAPKAGATFDQSG